MRVVVIGGGAREHAIAQTLKLAEATVVTVTAGPHPGLDILSEARLHADPTRPDAVVPFAKAQRADYAVIGPEAPLASGVSDALRTAGIPVVGPSRDAARIETSKRFCRELLARHRIDASPKFVVVKSEAEVDAAVGAFGGPFVVKPVGLTAGKGVRVQGRDFTTEAEGAAFAKALLSVGGEGVVLEERLEGEEFSLMAFVTDSGLYPMPLVQDYKRALEGDQGANTGGMGSYSQRDHLLPFLSVAARDQAVDILRRTVDALRAENLPFRGILYGGFMQTRIGPILLEINARFGDPEALNVLTLYEEGDFDELLYGVATGRVDPNLVRFRQRATAVKYLVPPGYGAQPKAGIVVDFDLPSIEAAGVRAFFGTVEPAGPARVRFATSRGLALVGEASAIHEASDRVDRALPFVRGAYYVRRDIGSAADVTRRVEHMRTLLSPGAKPSPLPLSVAAPDAPPSSAGAADELLGA